MESSFVPLALGIALVSLILSAVSYWRAGGRRDIEQLRAELTRELATLRARERARAERVARRIRDGYQESLARVERAQQHLIELRQDISAELRASIDALSARLTEAQQEIEEGLTRLKSEVSGRADAAQQALARRVRRLEGRVQLLLARAEIVRAERLAEERDFIAANNLLEDAVAKVREIRVRLSDVFEEDPAFTRVLAALHEAIAAVHNQAADHKSQIERVLSASDSLLASLDSREQALM